MQCESRIDRSMKHRLDPSNNKKNTAYRLDTQTLKQIIERTEMYHLNDRFEFLFLLCSLAHSDLM